MAVEYIEHYLVQTDDFEGTVRWYEDVLGLTRGPTPNFGFPVQWMPARCRPTVAAGELLTHLPGFR